MISRCVRPGIGLMAAGLVIAHAGIGAEDTRRIDPGKAPSSTAQRTSPGRTPPTKGPLPDPVLLDGSKQQAEKQSEQGMLGEFEIPGDENVRTGKVGGEQQPQGNMPPGGAQSAALPQGGGGPQGAQSQQGGAQGAQGAQAGGPQAAGGQQAGGAQAGGPADPNGAGGQIAGAADPNASAGGIQVAELKTDESNGPQGQGGAGDPGKKPGPIGIGDSAMQIKPVANAASVVGAQTAGQTQQMEKAMGTGGKAPTGNNSNRGAEKGRVMPAGL